MWEGEVALKGQIYRKSCNNSFSDNILLWEDVVVLKGQIYRKTYNNSLSENISLWKGCGGIETLIIQITVSMYLLHVQVTQVRSEIWLIDLWVCVCTL